MTVCRIHFSIIPIPRLSMSAQFLFLNSPCSCGKAVRVKLSQGGCRTPAHLIYNCRGGILKCTGGGGTIITTTTRIKESFGVSKSFFKCFEWSSSPYQRNIEKWKHFKKYSLNLSLLYINNTLWFIEILRYVSTHRWITYRCLQVGGHSLQGRGSLTI